MQHRPTIGRWPNGFAFVFRSLITTRPSILLSRILTEYIIDVFQAFDRVVDPHLAFARELQTFGKVQPGADNGPPDRFAHQNRIENVELK